MNTKEKIIQMIWEQIDSELVPYLSSIDPFDAWSGHSFERYLTEPYPAEWFSIEVVTAYRFCLNQILHIYLKCNGEVISFCEVWPIQENVCSGMEKFFTAMDPYWDDDSLEDAWFALGNIPVDTDNRLAEPFLHFPAGTDREEAWKWFDGLYTEGGVYALLNPNRTSAVTAPELPYGPLFSNKERAFIRKFGAPSEAEALIEAMESFADMLVYAPEAGHNSPLAPFAGTIYQMVHTLANQKNAVKMEE